MAKHKMTQMPHYSLGTYFSDAKKFGEIERGPIGGKNQRFLTNISLYFRNSAR